MKSGRSLAGWVGSVGAFQLSAQAIVMIDGVLLARWFSQDEVGKFGVMLAALLLGNAGSSLRLELAVAAAGSYDEKKSLVELALSANAVVSALFLCLALAGAVVGWTPWYFLFVPVSLAGSGGFDSLTALFVSEGRSVVQGVSRILVAGGQVASHTLVLVFWPDFAVLGLFLGFVIPKLLATQYLTRRVLGRWKAVALGIPSLSSGRALVASYSTYRNFMVWATLSGLLSQAYNQLLIPAFAILGGTAVAGQALIAMRTFSLPAQILSRTVSQIALTDMSEAVRCGALLERTKRWALWLLVPQLAYTSAILLVGPTLVIFVFGSEWEMAADLSRSLAPMIAFPILAVPVAQSLTAGGRQRQLSQWHLFRLLTGLTAVLVFRSASLATIGRVVSVHGSLLYLLVIAVSLLAASRSKHPVATDEMVAESHG